jgi:hypothetical protein
MIIHLGHAQNSFADKCSCFVPCLAFGRLGVHSRDGLTGSVGMSFLARHNVLGAKSRLGLLGLMAVIAFSFRHGEFHLSLR